MRIVSFFSICCLLLFLWSLPTSASAQVCGDVSSNSEVDLSDLTRMIDYTMGNAPISVINEANADCDGLPGLTMADALAIADSIFWLESLDCTPSGAYSFAPITTDTIFLPQLLSIPDYIDELSLPIRCKLLSGHNVLYLPLLPIGAGSTAPFSYSDITEGATGQAFLGAQTLSLTDTALVGAIDFPRNDFQGLEEFAYVHYTRNGPGNGALSVDAVDRSSLLRTSVGDGTDLYVPVIQYYMYELPADTLYVTPNQFIAAAVVDTALTDTFSITVTSGANPSIEFTAASADDWISFIGGPPGPMTTPATLQFTLETLPLGAGTYNGLISFTTTDTSVIIPDADIPVLLDVEPPIIYPFGDINCDGKANLTDITVLVNHLFLGFPAGTPCD